MNFLDLEADAMTSPLDISFRISDRPYTVTEILQKHELRSLGSALSISNHHHIKCNRIFRIMLIPLFFVSHVLSAHCTRFNIKLSKTIAVMSANDDDDKSWDYA